MFAANFARRFADVDAVGPRRRPEASSRRFVRVVLLTQIVPVAEAYKQLAVAHGHEVPALIVARPVRRRAATPFAGGRRRRHRPAHPPRRSARWRRFFAPTRPTSASAPAFRGSFPRRRSTCRGSASSTAIRRCSREGVGRTRGPGRCEPARPRSASPTTTWTPPSTPATSSPRSAIPLGPDDTEETLLPHLHGRGAGARSHMVFERLEAGDPGRPQGEGEYQRDFEPEYADRRPGADGGRGAPAGARLELRLGAKPCRPACWSRTAPVAAWRGRASSEVDGAERLDCADGPLWILESESA